MCFRCDDSGSQFKEIVSPRATVPVWALLQIHQDEKLYVRDPIVKRTWFVTDLPNAEHYTCVVTIQWDGGGFKYDDEVVLNAIRYAF